MTAHTPGPWLLREGSGNYLWEVVVERRAGRSPRVICRPSGDHREANARLIAAAPDLLAAIKNSDDAHWTPAMRAAMAKATGALQE